MAGHRTIAAVFLGAVVSMGNAQAPPTESAVNKVFAKWTTSTPGCAVGVAVGGKTVLTKAYGMADLEHDVPNTVDTIFEAGSVAKQFTAMAVLLLVKDGKVSLDDPARRAPRVNTPTRTSSILSAARSRLTSPPARSGRTPTPASTWPRSSCRESAGCRWRNSRAPASSARSA
jgi:hypothetical protein